MSNACVERMVIKFSFISFTWEVESLHTNIHSADVIAVGHASRIHILALDSGLAQEEQCLPALGVEGRLGGE